MSGVARLAARDDWTRRGAIVDGVVVDSRSCCCAAGEKEAQFLYIEGIWSCARWAIELPRAISTSFTAQIPC